MGCTFLPPKSWRPFLVVALKTRKNYLHNLSHHPDLPNFLKNWTLALPWGALTTFPCKFGPEKNFSPQPVHLLWLCLCWIQIRQIWGHSWGGINSGVSFCNNSMVACAIWAFQVSQGSVETLFRWGGKCLYHFAANLIRKLHTKFHQNRLTFIEDITLTFCLFFRAQCIVNVTV